MSLYQEEAVDVDHVLVLNEKIFLVVNKFPKMKENIESICSIMEKNEMFPYYNEVFMKRLSNITLDNSTLEKMKISNKKKIKELEEKIEDAKKNLGESEVREGHLNKSKYLYQIGAKDLAVKSFKETIEKTVDSGSKIDIVFTLIRIGFGFNDIDLIKNNVERAKNMIEIGGDWERRNRLKIYEGAYRMKVRDFKGASALFVDSVATFSCYEFITFHKFIFYSVLMTMFTLGRTDLKKKVINSSDVLAVIDKLPHLGTFLNSLYECKYNLFLRSLMKMEDEMKKDHILKGHVSFFSREMRIKAYSQFLQSYKSVTMKSMCDNFGISIDLLDKELSKFISFGRMNCKINKVDKVINTTRPKEKNAQYSTLIKKGDIILARLQKLSRVVDL